jgi:hypothetical protein
MNQQTFWEDKGGFEGFNEGDVTLFFFYFNPISIFYVFSFFSFPIFYLFVFFFYGLIFSVFFFCSFYYLLDYHKEGSPFCIFFLLGHGDIM